MDRNDYLFGGGSIKMDNILPRLGGLILSIKQGSMDGGYYPYKKSPLRS